MKVVAATPLYPPSSRVGAWLATHRFLARLVELGHSVDVITLLGDADYTFEGVTVHGSRTKIDLLDGADVLISHVGAGESWVIYAGTIGIPNIKMVHSKGEHTEDLLSRTGTALAVFSSESLRASVTFEGDAIICQPITVAAEHVTSPGKSVTLINPTVPKGAELFKFLAASLPDRRFLTVQGGYGAQMPVKSPNCDNVRMTVDMRDIWSRTRILAMPSLTESWGMAGVEAMSSGIPVIAHPCDGLLESLGPAGIFVDRSDLGGWRREVERLHDPDEWAAASAAALTRSAELEAVSAASLTRFVDAATMIGDHP